MRITFLCQYFPPEMGAPSARTFEHARHWARLGHEVTVITGFPNHPTGVIRPEYRGAIVKRERVAGIDLLRAWVYVTANRGFAKRILNFLSFFGSSIFFGALLTKRPDVVVGTSPQFFCAVGAYVLSLIKRAPFVFEVRDIWPRSAVELGVLRNPLLIRVLEGIEMFLYRRAALIVPVAESTRDYLLERGIPAEKIRIVPNGIDAEYLESATATADEIRAQYGAQGKFLVSYIGTHGISHALNVVLQAARLVASERDIQFLFVGEGAEKEALKARAAEWRLANVVFVDQQAREKLLGFYRASDVSLVPLKRLGIFRKVLPSKLFELMGAGCPIICSVEGEAAQLVRRAESGLCIEPENPQAMVDAILRLRADADLRRQLRENGQEFVRKNYLRSKLAERYLEALGAVLSGRLVLRGAQQPAADHRPPMTYH